MLTSIVLYSIIMLSNLHLTSGNELESLTLQKTTNLEKSTIDNPEDMIIKFLQNDSYQNEVLGSNNTNTITQIINQANDSTTDEIIALIKKKKKLIPKWQLSAGVYLEHKVNKKLLKKAMKDFKLMSILNGTDFDTNNNKNDIRIESAEVQNDGGVSDIKINDIESITKDDESDVINSNVIHHIPSSSIVSRASPNTRNLFAENITEYVRLYDGDNDDSNNNVTIKYNKKENGKYDLSNYDASVDTSENNCLSINLTSKQFWTVLLAIFCFL
ncbi:hypothetical protein KGF54_004789 [Candida jiufengensis]|uniref:uncharacterized protein n=1 Tax=Candida jiufengensis TaxID=497108 RepID=UPI00222470D7|nr:uncharacterized protein KGF54_004789 [Candida jiufengensis]KAI5951714.1 hypothetical protein KGF54_004789 [Candida jiufengensis]